MTSRPHSAPTFPFFLYGRPALATGRGEQVTAASRLPPCGLLAVAGSSRIWRSPPLGPTGSWPRFPEALNGGAGRAADADRVSAGGDLPAACRRLLQRARSPGAPQVSGAGALPGVLSRSAGALGTLMSGSGSTTFALVADERQGQALRDGFVSSSDGRAGRQLVPLADAGGLPRDELATGQGAGRHGRTLLRAMRR